MISDETDKFSRMEKVSVPKDRRSSYAANRLINQQGVAEGPNMPPTVVTGLRVLPPSQFRVLSVQNIRGATSFILSWINSSPMTFWNPTYAIYTYGNNTAVSWHGQNENSPLWDGPLQDPTLTLTPPVQVIVPGMSPKRVIFAIQTRLTNGLTSDEGAMPTCAGECDPVQQYVQTVLAAYTCTLNDDVLVADATAGAFAITLLSVTLLPMGKTVTVKNITPGTNVTMTAATGETIDGAGTLVLNAGTPVCRLISDRASWRTY